MREDPPVLINVKGALELVCVKCTRAALFRATDRRAAEEAATAKGWGEYRGKIVCPACPK